MKSRATSWLSRILAAASLVLLGNHCREVDPTQVLLEVTAEPLARTRGRTLQVTFLDDRGAVAHEASAALTGESAIELPTVIPVVPANKDSERVFRLVAELRDASGRTFNRYEGLGSFVENRIVERRVVLVDVCNDRICPSGQSCTDGTCQDVAVLPAPSAAPPALDVGPGRPYATPCAAITAARAGDTIQIHTGTYAAEPCVISHDRLVIRGIGPRPIIDAAGTLAENRAHWIVRASSVVIENLEIRNATGADPTIGAALFLDGPNFTLRDSALRSSHGGLYTNEDATSEVLVERCELDQVGVGFQANLVGHGLRIGRLKRFTLLGSWIHDGISGHLVRSEAADNWIEGNRLLSGTRTDPDTGAPLAASYELNFPLGGRAIVLGNVLQQSSATSNAAVLSYGEEGSMPDTENPYLYVSHNTFVSRRGDGATFVRVSNMTGEVRLLNDVFAGNGTVTNFGTPTIQGQCTDPGPFADEATFDFRLGTSSSCIDRGVDPGNGAGYSLTPATQPTLPLGREPRLPVRTPDPGAFEAP